MQRTRSTGLASCVLIVLIAIPAALADGPQSEISANHWALQTIESHEAPAVSRTTWPRGTMDCFILARLETAGLSPSPPAERRSWLRRVTFDLVGLPATSEEIDTFLSDESPAAYHTVVDRLLASPHFGEHWGQRWLDVVRYAETHGQEQDEPIRNAFRYRDYVIRALNGDLPYNRFVVEHVAGDLVHPPRIDPVAQTNQSIQGTAFWLLGQANHIPIDLRGDEAERRENQIEVFSKAFLALTANCARCHDHKFDAITTEDYYALCGYLQSSSYQQANVADPVRRERSFQRLADLQSKYSRLILKAYADAIRASRLAGYLAAAGETIRGNDKRRAARGDGLQEEVVQQWVQVLQDSEQDIESPLYPYARLALKSIGPDGKAFNDVKHEIVHAWQQATKQSAQQFGSQKTITTHEEGERNFVSTEQPLKPSDLVVDFSRPGPEDWIATGLRFGRRAARVGELRIGKNEERRITGVLVVDAAHAGLFSDKLTGFLRTRTFEVTSDTLWYRFTGKADVFMVVDSYRAGARPGSVHHGKYLFVKLEGDGNFRWQSHLVRRYIGHRVHIEFTPHENFALSRIQFCSEEPGDVFQPNSRLVKLLESPAANSLPGVAQLYEELLFRATNELADTSSQQGVGRRDAAGLVNWLFTRRKLLAIPPDAWQRISLLCQTYAEKKAEIEAELPPPDAALALLDGSGEDEFVHFRGDHQRLSEDPVPRRNLSVLGGRHEPRPAKGSGRLQFAHQLTSATNPLVSRVIVNRLWHHLFGQGIVRTVDDLGVMGERPSHPHLLDYLAGRFVEEGWSLKWQIRKIVLSQTYRMSSRPDPGFDGIDPANQLLHRMPIRRLSAEAIRDSILAVSGRLDAKMHGASVKAHFNDFTKGYQPPKENGPADGEGRRSIYLEVRRNLLPHLLTTFGRPVPITTRGQRDESTTAAQPLILLNDPFVHQQARLWAERLLAATDRAPHERVEQAFLMAFGRPPEAWELDAAQAFLDEQAEDTSTNSRHAAWTDFCHTLLNVKEFIFNY